MKTEIKKLPQAQVEIYFEIPWPEFEGYYEKALAKLNEAVTLDGFRAGKAPKEIAEQRFGEARVLEDAAELALQEKYAVFIVDNNLEVIGQPHVEILKLAKGNSFECRVKAGILPEAILPDYYQIASTIKKSAVQVEDKEFDDALDWIRKSRATFEDLDRPAEKEDFVQINYQSPKLQDNKPFEDRFYLGRGKLIPGFEDQVEGMKTGEEKEFELPFPSDYYLPELAGQTANFKLQVNKVQKAILPDLTDEFAKSLGAFEDLEGLKKNIKEGLTQEKEREKQQAHRAEILEKIMEQSSLEIPPPLLQQEKEQLRHQIEHDAKEQLDITLAQHIENNFKSEADFESSLEKQATGRIKSYLVIQAIGQKEKISVSDSEVDTACDNFLQRYAKKEDVEKEFDPAKLKSYYKGVIYNEKVLELLEKLAPQE